MRTLTADLSLSFMDLGPSVMLLIFIIFQRTYELMFLIMRLLNWVWAILCVSKPSKYWSLLNIFVSPQDNRKPWTCLLEEGRRPEVPLAKATLYVHQEPQPPRGYRRGGHAAEDESVDDKRKVSIVFDYGYNCQSRGRGGRIYWLTCILSCSICLISDEEAKVHFDKWANGL